MVDLSKAQNIRVGAVPLDTLKIREVIGLGISGRPLNGEITHVSSPDDLSDNSLVFFDDVENEDIITRLSSFDNVLAIVKGGSNFIPRSSHIVCDYPRQIWGQLVRVLYDYERQYVFNEDMQFQNCIIGTNVRIASSSVISHGCKIGNGTIVQDNVFIGPYTEIHDNCILMAGAIVGSQGFGPNRFRGVPESLPHVGGVKIESGCEIGAGSVIDSGTIFPTMLEKNVKLGSLVHIAHNARIGTGSFLAARSGVSGSAQIGQDCFIGAGAMIRDGVTLGDRVHAGLLSAVVRNFADDKIIAGNPARELGAH